MARPSRDAGSPHVIRLQGPWQYQVLARTTVQADGRAREEADSAPIVGRIKLPADWGETLGPDFRGRVLFTRRFNCPTGIEPGDRVDLVLEQADSVASVSLAGRRLGTLRLGDAPARFEITPFLQPHTAHELSVEVLCPAVSAEGFPLARPAREPFPGGLIGEVRLEIIARHSN